MPVGTLRLSMTCAPAFAERACEFVCMPQSSACACAHVDIVSLLHPPPCASHSFPTSFAFPPSLPRPCPHYCPQDAVRLSVLYPLCRRHHRHPGRHPNVGHGAAAPTLHARIQVDARNVCAKVGHADQFEGMSAGAGKGIPQSMRGVAKAAQMMGGGGRGVVREGGDEEASSESLRGGDELF